MIARLIKRYLPQSLFGRFLLIIIVPTIVVQSVAIYMFYERHWDNISIHMARSLIGEVLIVKDLIEGRTEIDSNYYLDVATAKLNIIRAEFIPDRKIPPNYKNQAGFKYLKSELQAKANTTFSAYLSPQKRDLIIDLEVNDGVLRVTSSKKRIINPTTYIFILWMTGTAAVLLIIAIIFMRNQIRPIKRLAEAAEKFGKGIELKKFKPEGAQEVKRAAQAFINMKRRIARQVEQRTEMLAGVSHDLKTPITRIKLQLEMMKKDPNAEELKKDISELEEMVKEYLDFAQGNKKTVFEPVNITDLLRSIVSGYRKHHHKIDVKCQKGITLTLNQNSFRRTINNLLDNAIHYAKKVQVEANTNEKYLFIFIDDDGPGIPPKKRELVFKPFYKIDRSRNLDKGGTGLGMAIAKDTITGLGGQIKLEDSPLGGLRIIIKLPL